MCKLDDVAIWMTIDDHPNIQRLDKELRHKEKFSETTDVLWHDWNEPFS